MTDKVEIRRVKMKVWKGEYKPNLILLREGLTREEEEKTLKHEFLHHAFYMKHKWLRPWFHTRFCLSYTTSALLTLLFSAQLYFILVIPLLLLLLQECYVSAITTCWGRILQSACLFMFLIVLGAWQLGR